MTCAAFHCTKAMVRLLCAVVLCWATTGAFAAETKMHRVGVFTPGMAFEPVFRGLQDGLSRAGFNEGKNIQFVVENTHGSSSDLSTRITQLLETKPDVIYVVSTVHAVAAKHATSTIPIVFAWVGDPVQSGLIASHSASNNNLTGISNQSDALSGKRLEALMQIAPATKRILAVVSPKEYIAESSFRFLQDTAKRLGVTVVRREAMTAEELRQVLRETRRGSVDAIYLVPSAHLVSNIELQIEKAKQDHLPLVVHEESMVEKGALVSYGPDFRSAGIQSSRLLVKVLKGEKPANIPSETPEKLLLVVNLGTAKTIGLKIPREVVERADRLVD